ncbi:hypothetical protein RBSH_03391 [Rhodopirellula baltica SH28]|uniref:Uncharacterized protein n=1 Tax=Rhodopirellula baltica SH28 TaxID=993517 RepID=K5DES5_RHOBT|nr:hypothetical protein RBSH_03391 [Rhodopirellula baltica SH28]
MPQLRSLSSTRRCQREIHDRNRKPPSFTLWQITFNRIVHTRKLLLVRVAMWLAPARSGLLRV